MTRYRAHFTTSGAAAPPPRRRLHFRGAVKLQNGALNANEILERRCGRAGEVNLRQREKEKEEAPFNVLALSYVAFFASPHTSLCSSCRFDYTSDSTPSLSLSLSFL